MSSDGPVDWRKIFSPHSILFSVLGVLSAVVALEGYMLPNDFIDGGLAGTAIVLFHLLNLPDAGQAAENQIVSFVLVALNLLFLAVRGYKVIGKTFAIQSAIVMILFLIAMNTICITTLTDIKILSAFFGGFFMGLAVGFVILAGGVLDSLEVGAEWISKKTGLSTGEIGLTFNTLVILSAVIVLGKDIAMYSILTYFTAMKVSDYVVNGFEEFTALMVISDKHERIKSLIVNDFQKGISVFKGERGYLPESFHVKHEADIIMTVVTRLQIRKIKEAIIREDPKAFVYVTRIKEVKGGVVKPLLKRL